jgi:hypothetical protein
LPGVDDEYHVENEYPNFTEKEVYSFGCVQNSSDYIVHNVLYPSDYINNYNVIEWIIPWIPYTEIMHPNWSPVNIVNISNILHLHINVTYSHELNKSDNGYVLKYALIPLDYEEINVTIT